MSEISKGLVLNDQNIDESRNFLSRIINIGLRFKLQKQVNARRATPEELKLKLVKPLSDKGVSVDGILDEFEDTILPYCTNFAAEKFMGFPDTGSSVAGIGGAVMTDLLQQNLINQSFCAPSATFVEVAVIQWLRDTVGYSVTDPKNIWDVGGIITPGGTSSNTIAMMLARENHRPQTLELGMADPINFKIVVPRGIGHYSVKSAQRWLGCGNNLLEVPTNDFRYDIAALHKVLTENKGSVMAVIAYAGDSRTMTVDNLAEVARCVRSVDPAVWLHADACHGFSLGFSKTLKSKIAGIEEFDSISTDPHKVLAIPYTLSALLVKDPLVLKTITSTSDLIMQEEFAFGQIIPFVGSKPWSSLKLWFMMKNFGRDGLDELITMRHNTAKTFAQLVSDSPSFTLINNVDINAVAFMFTDTGADHSLSQINNINRAIHQRILQDGKYHLHQFSIADPGVLERGEIIYPLRFMSGNPNLTLADMEEVLSYVHRLGMEIKATCT